MQRLLPSFCVGLCVGLAGCSFVMTTPPRAPAAGQPVRCDAEYVIPSVDAAVGAGGFLLGASAIALSELLPEEPGDRDAGTWAEVAVVTTWLVVFGAGAVYGFRNAHRCKALRARAGLLR